MLLAASYTTHSVITASRYPGPRTHIYIYLLYSHSLYVAAKSGDAEIKGFRLYPQQYQCIQNVSDFNLLISLVIFAILSLVAFVSFTRTLVFTLFVS